MFPDLIIDAFRDKRPGICVAYRTNGQIFNQQWIHFQSSVSSTSVHELLCADDCVFNVNSESDKKRSMKLSAAAACGNFYGDVASGFRLQGGHGRRYKDTLKTSLKRLQINPANWDDLSRNRPTWRRTVKTATAIYEDNHVPAAKAKCKARNFHLTRTTSADVPPCVSVSPPTLTINTDRTPEPPISSSSSIASKFATAAPVPTTTAHNSDTSTNINPPPTTPTVWTRSIRVLIAIAPSPHPSAWSVTCESIAQRLANQRLEHQPALAASASTALTAPAHSHTAWAY
ncbi:hypothetical protein SprV_0100242800 [Sparganum proliferum]